ncbi:Ubiquitin--protein ligase [Cinnamomum micranthum f. kanehirae]|uniref:Ubiquitin--protein ligase n=1 Tax=Cinnamomum micranthum f. kanehirae TaxID=337451 RepID=A0A3S3PZH1_9MAGN|nr:Ubiquitin--protein ligase [Cinnamomum micranthum f. kanehirae]
MVHEVVLIVDDLVSPLSISQCRICHEEEEEDGSSSKRLETPCACSGTVKFAHRECIQRWCEEKGNTTCEICLQKFEPGYTIPKKARLADVAVTIRESLEVPRQGDEMHNARLLALVAAEGETLDPDYAECSSGSDRSASCCRSVALIFTILLLVRHLASVLTGGTDHYAFAVFTLLLLRAGGVLLPLYIMMRAIEAIRRRQRQHQQYYASTSSLEEAEEGDDDDEDEDDDNEEIEHTVQIHH